MAQIANSEAVQTVNFVVQDLLVCTSLERGEMQKAICRCVTRRPVNTWPREE